MTALGCGVGSHLETAEVPLSLRYTAVFLDLWGVLPESEVLLGTLGANSVSSTRSECVHTMSRLLPRLLRGHALLPFHWATFTLSCSDIC